MIITTQKPLKQIMEYLAPYTTILIIGCGTCATEVQTGGEKQVKEMADDLRGRWFIDTTMIETACDERLARRDWKKIHRSNRRYDAVLALACGAGVQTLSEVMGIPCLPGLDTHFLGKVERIGLYYERCRACGVCLLGETAGICPVTRCAKGLLNGPCGGMMDGKCEVGGYVRDCAWVLIWDRLQNQGRMELFRQKRAPKEFGLQAYPRGIDAIPSHMKIKRNPILRPNETEEMIIQILKSKATS